MSSRLTTQELRKMSAEDIRKEVTEKEAKIAKSRLSIALQSEKDTAAYRRDKRDIARMLTLLSEKESGQDQLKSAKKKATMPPPASSPSGNGVRRRTGAGTSATASS